jgi:RNA polymerase sigma factor (sigma-70 family)
VESVEFVQRLAAGATERRAVMHDLYPRLLQQVSTACRKRGVYRAADTEDVLQDVCEVILTKWRTFQVENNLWGWIGTIIKNKVIDVHRRGSRLSSIDQPQQAEDRPPILIEPSMTHDPVHEDCVARVLSQLTGEGPARAGSIRTIELINFIVDCGTDTQSLAEFLGCGESAAKERKRYALEKIRELCARFCESHECAATLSR